MVKIGDGGCRGTAWNKKGCPKFVGRVTLEKCAAECRKHPYCTSFHVLKPDEKDQTHECFLFGHKEVTAVKSLGGACYILQGKEEEEEDVKLGKISTFLPFFKNFIKEHLCFPRDHQFICSLF